MLENKKNKIITDRRMFGKIFCSTPTAKVFKRFELTLFIPIANLFLTFL